MPAGVARNRVARGCERRFTSAPPRLRRQQSIYIFVRTTASIFHPATCVVYHCALVFVLPSSVRESKRVHRPTQLFANCVLMSACLLSQFNFRPSFEELLADGSSPQKPPGSYTHPWKIMQHKRRFCFY
jgi:hypothetical protein